MVNVGVVGGGIMGTQIALLLSLGGYKVQIYNCNSPEETMPRIQQLFRRHLRRNPMPPDRAEEVLRRIALVPSMEGMAGASLVIEAVVEDLAVKKDVFRQLEQVCRPDAVLASNTSSLEIASIGEGVKGQDRLLGIHFFNPVLDMELVEIIGTPKTSAESMEKAVSLARSLKKHPLCFKEPLVNRILIPMINEACWLLENDGAKAEDIDRAMKLGAHHPVGPLTLADLIGIDVVVAILESYRRRMGEKYMPAPLLYDMVKKGTLGRKSGKGFFSYA